MVSLPPWRTSALLHIQLVSSTHGSDSSQKYNAQQKLWQWPGQNAGGRPTTLLRGTFASRWVKLQRECTARAGMCQAPTSRSAHMIWGLLSRAVEESEQPLVKTKWGKVVLEQSCRKSRASWLQWNSFWGYASLKDIYPGMCSKQKMKVGIHNDRWMLKLHH